MDVPDCGATERAVIAQQPDEDPGVLAGRVIRRVSELARQQTPLECAVIVTSNEISPDVLASRCRMARALVRAMEGAPSARLLFVPQATLCDEGRHELLSIAGTLALQLDHVPVEVSVRFDPPREEPEPQSETRLRKPAIWGAVADVA
jgi:hypothetical protein